jgi:hypothetical protein
VIGSDSDHAAIGRDEPFGTVAVDGCPDLLTREEVWIRQGLGEMHGTCSGGARIARVARDMLGLARHLDEVLTPPPLPSALPVIRG